jgi:hypothetical protein
LEVDNNKVDSLDDSTSPSAPIDDQALDDWAASTLAVPERDTGTKAEALPSFVKPAGQMALEAKSRRTRRRLIILIIFVILVGAALAWLGYNFLLGNNRAQEVPLQTSNNLEVPDDVSSDSAPVVTKYETATVPNLVGLFGLNVDEVSARLGEGWALIKSDPTIDDENPEVTMLATFSFTPKVLIDPNMPNSGATGDSASMDAGSNAHAGSAPSAKLYLSLDGEGRVVDVYYAGDMDLLGIPQTDFMSLLGNDDLVFDTLAMAGVSPKEFSYQVPDANSTVTYDKPDSDQRKIMKQSTTFSGRTTNEGAPTAWTVLVNYEFIPPATSTTKYDSVTRTIYLRLS